MEEHEYQKHCYSPLQSEASVQGVGRGCGVIRVLVIVPPVQTIASIIQPELSVHIRPEQLPGHIEQVDLIFGMDHLVLLLNTKGELLSKPVI